MTRTLKKTFALIAKAPFLAFLVLLALLFVIIFIGTKVRAPEIVDDSARTIVKNVRTMNTNETQYVRATGSVEKIGVTTITATTNGIVNRINTATGAHVARGKVLVTLADTYGGGNVATVSSQIAARQVQNQNEIFDKSTSIADDQRADVRGNDDDDAIARKQFTIQKRNLELSRDLAVLERRRAGQEAARYYPTAPFAGVVERVFVTPGDTVITGAPLLTLRSGENEARVTVTVGKDVARAVSIDTPSRITGAHGTEIDIIPTYISSTPTDAQAYSITFVFDDTENIFAENDFIDVNLALQNGGTQTLIPLDAVQLTNDGAIVFVVDQDVACARTVTLGDVLGAFVVVEEGLDHGAIVITQRTVVDGDRVRVDTRESADNRDRVE